ncbi:MAG: PH domain-containing protein [Rickettsiales bacterium]|nr:PH domain-containing protein [Rickettsiales bacterium]
MPTLDEVRKQIAACPHHYIFWTNKEIRALPKVLDKNEIIRAVTSGMMKNATWLAVCTSRRLIFLNCGMFYGVRQVQLPLDRIQSIDHASTIFFGSIRVWDGASYFSIDMVNKKSIQPFVKATEAAMEAARNKKDVKPAATVDIADQLERLAQLREKGHLTEEEFQSQKKKLLA